MASLSTNDAPHVGVTAPDLLPKSTSDQLQEVLDQANSMKDDANDYSRFDKLQDPDDVDNLEEAKVLKEEGNRFFKMRNYYEAIGKYTEVVDLLKSSFNDETSSAKEVNEEVQTRVAALSNRAACHLKLRNFKDCIKDCDTILKKDKEHTKALFRRAQAHKSKGMNEMAYRDILLLLDVDSTNKPAQKEKRKLEKDLHSRSRDAIRSRIEKDKRDAAEKIRKKKEKERKKQMIEDEKRRKEERLANTGATTTTKATDMAPPAKVDVNTDDVVKERSKESGELMRGYKKTKDGKTTSYFTRELDEKAKVLLGDTAPKKLDQSSSRPVERKTSNTSAWNSAGTYEERDRSQFCTDLLKEMVGSNSGIVVDDDAYTATVTGVKKVEGEASMIHVRGTLRFLWDYTFSIQYKILLKSNNKSLKGSLSYVDFTQNVKEPPSITNKVIGNGFKDGDDQTTSNTALAALREKIDGALVAFGVECKKELEK